MITKCCENCAHSQKGFFIPCLLYCGAKSVQLVEVKKDYVCDTWALKDREK